MNSRIALFAVGFAVNVAVRTSGATLTTGSELRVDQATASYGVETQQVLTLPSGARVIAWIQFPPLGASPERVQVVGRVNPAGQVLSSPASISTTPGAGGLSNLRMTARGNDVFAAWERVVQFSPTRYEIRFNHSSDGGTTWGQDRAVSPAALNADGGFSLASGPNADVFVAFAGTRTQYHVYLVRSLNNGADWQTPVRIDHSSGAARPSMAADAAGRVVVVWSDLRGGRSIFGNRSTDEGHTFAATDSQVSTIEGLGIDVETDGAGNFFTGFEAAPVSEVEAYVSSSLDYGRTWGQPLRVDQSEAGIQFATLQVSAGGSGRIYTTAVYNFNGAYGLYLRKSDDNGVTFQPPQRLDAAPTGTQVYFARIASKPNGVVLVPWAQLQTGTSLGVVLARVSTDFGNTWSQLVTLSGAAVVPRAFPK